MEVCNGSVQWKCAMWVATSHNRDYMHKSCPSWEYSVNVVYYAPVGAFSQDYTVKYISKRSRHSGSVLQCARGATHLSNRLSSVYNLVLSERVVETTRLPTERCE